MTNRRPTDAEDNQPVGRRRLLGGRAAAFAVASVVLVGMISIPAKQLLDQHYRLSALQGRIDQNNALIAKLQGEVDRWSDPAFVKAQARQRLKYVMPGEVGYIVLEADEVRAATNVLAKPNAATPWYRTLWQSMKAAGSTTAPQNGDH